MKSWWSTRSVVLIHIFTVANCFGFGDVDLPMQLSFPPGPKYDNVGSKSKACSTPGSISAFQPVDGASYLEITYGYSLEHLRRLESYPPPYLW